MRFLHQVMGAIAALMFTKPRVHDSAPTYMPTSSLFHGSVTNYGSGLDWPSIYHARKNSRRGKIIRRMRGI